MQRRRNFNDLSVILFTFLVLIASYIHAACPNNCSGKGTCSGQTCTCYPGYGYSNDCSQQVCPSGEAWFDKPSGSTVAHSLVECSNAGKCNRRTGVCICFDGWEGDNCAKKSCPNNCSQHGVCKTTSQAAKYYGPQSQLGSGLGPVYTNWEKNTMGICACDVGYTGPDCSLKTCPKGDNPKTTGQSNVVVTITTGAAGGTLAGTFSLLYQGFEATFTADGANATDSTCASSIISALSNVAATSTCTVGTADAEGGVTYTLGLVFTQQASLNNIYSQGTIPTVESFQCFTDDVTGGTTPTCTVAVNPTNVAVSNIVEYEYCAGNGICDFTSGQCTCFSGYTGTLCDVASDNIAWGDNTPALTLGSEYSGFTSNVLQLSTTKSASTDFKFLDAQANNVSVFSVRGDGALSIDTINTKYVTTTEGLAVSTSTAGVAVTSTYNAGNVNSGFKVDMTDATFTDNVFITSTTNSCNNDPCEFKLFRAIAGTTTTVFDIGGDGETTIHTGGLSVAAGGITVSAGGLTVSAGGATITSGGLDVQGGGITVAGTSTFNDAATVTTTVNNSNTFTIESQGNSLASSVDVLLIKAPNISGAFTTLGGVGIADNLYVGGVFHVEGDYSATSNLYIGGVVHIGKNLSSSSGSTGSLTVSGGVGISQDLHVGAATVTSSSLTGAITLAGGIGIKKGATIGGESLSSSSTSGSLKVAGGVGIAKQLYVGATLHVEGTTESTSPTSGAATFGGGIGVSGNLNVSGAQTITDDTDASNATTGGSFTTSGGAAIAKKAFVGGNLDIASVTDSTSSLNGTTLSVVGTSDSTSATSGTVTVAGGVGVAADLYVGGIGVVTGSVDATTSTSGALNVSGGLGVQKSIYVGDHINVKGGHHSESAETGTITVTGGIGVSYDIYSGRSIHGRGTTQADSSLHGALTTSGGAGIAMNLFVGGSANIQSVNTSTQTTNGALTVVGGVGIGENVNIGGITSIDATTDSTSSHTGSLVVGGGAGIGKTAFIGGGLHVQGTTASTSATTGTVTIGGGVGIGGDVNIGSTSVATNTSSGSLSTAGGFSAAGDVYIGDGLHIAGSTASTDNTSGTVTIAGGVGIVGGLNAGGDVSTSGTTQSDSTLTGSFVAAGGAGIGKQLYVGERIHINQQTDIDAESFLGGSVKVHQRLTVDGWQDGIATSFPSTSTDSGSLIVGGGVGVAMSVYTGGGVHIQGDAASSSSLTGTFTVAGGVGIMKDLNVGGDIDIGGSIFQPSGGYSWPDYVFEPDYPLMPLDAFQKFIEKEKHLPNVTSAADMKSEGFNLGLWIKRLLEKVEESSLYILQLHKNVLDLQAKGRQLESNLDTEKQKMVNQNNVIKELNSRVTQLEQNIIEIYSKFSNNNVELNV
eukprot:GSMAST32.ASY1.ANO1.325.1 assembled CDS